VTGAYLENMRETACPNGATLTRAESAFRAVPGPESGHSL